MGKLKALLGILVIAALFYYAWNLVPVMFTNYQFQDELDDICRRASYLNTSTDDDIKKLVVTKAKSMDLAVKEEQVTVSHGVGGLGITVHYHVHLDLLIHPYDSDVTANSLNKRI
jgi:hypothetical protein